MMLYLLLVKMMKNVVLYDVLRLVVGLAQYRHVA